MFFARKTAVSDWDCLKADFLKDFYQNELIDLLDMEKLEL